MRCYMQPCRPFIKGSISVPFESQAQQRYLYAHPEKVGGKEKLSEWAKETDFSHLPKRKKKKKSLTDHMESEE
jgi:hypothetical protein